MALMSNPISSRLLVDKVDTEAMEDQTAKDEIGKGSLGADLSIFHQLSTDCVYRF